MTSGFQQQNPNSMIALPRAAPRPQHGQKADPSCVKPPPLHAFKPRPGH